MEYEELCAEHEELCDEFRRVYAEYKEHPTDELLERCRTLGYTISDIEWDMSRCKPDFDEVRRPRYTKVYSRYNNA